MIILTLQPKAQEVALKIDKEKLKTEDESWFQELVRVLDDLYFRDANYRVFILSDEFVQNWGENENVRDFVIKWGNKVENL